MPKVLINNQPEKKNGLATLADWAGGFETAADVASLYGPASLYASPAAAISGTIKDAARYFDDKQSGYTTLANISNHIGWGLVGMIPGAKAAKLTKAGKTTAKAGKVTQKAQAASQNSEELLAAYKQAEANLNKARERYNRLKFWKVKPNLGALEEEYKAAKTAYEKSVKGGNDLNLKDLLSKVQMARIMGKTAASGGIAYGLPGTEEYIRENSDSSFTPLSIGRGFLYGTVGNGLSILGEDLQNIDDWQTAGRLASTFILPNANSIKRVGVKQPTITRKPRKPSSSKKKSQKNQSTEQQKPRVDYGMQPEIPGKKFGGKLKHLNDLRQ